MCPCQRVSQLHLKRCMMFDSFCRVHFNFQLHSYAHYITLHYIEKLIMNNFRCRSQRSIVAFHFQQSENSRNVIWLSRILFGKNQKFIVANLCNSRFNRALFRALQCNCPAVLLHPFFQFDVAECKYDFYNHCHDFPGLVVFIFICWHIEIIGSDLVVQSTFNNIYQYLISVSLAITLKLSILLWYEAFDVFAASFRLVGFSLVKTAW